MKKLILPFDIFEEIGSIYSFQLDNKLKTLIILQVVVCYHFINNTQFQIIL